MKRIASLTAALVLLLAVTAVARGRPATTDEFLAPGGRTWVIAHRGFSGRAPENTVAAIREAIEIGADMAEIDVTLTADNRVVVIHDETLQRTTNDSGNVAEHDFDEIRSLDAGSWFAPQFAGEKVPTLSEVLDLVKGQILLNVEIKSEAVDRGISDKVAAAIKERGMTDQVIVSSFSPTALEQMHAVAPEIRTAVLYNKELQRGQDPVEIVRGLGASAFNIRGSRLKAKMLRSCREQGIPVAVYTVDKPRKMKRWVKKGIDAIFTNHPDRLLEVLEKAPAASPSPNLVPAAALP
jgi:glycerophosphoryl diester phosphodiesterase